MFDIDKSNFSFFDLFAYIIPGAIVLFIIVSCGVVESVPYNGVANWYNIILEFWSRGVSPINTIWFLLASYVSGHLVSFLSCVTVEAYSHWSYKYPSDFLMLRSRLNMQTKDKNRKENTYNPYTWVTCGLRIIICAVIIPITFYDLILGNLLKFKYYYLKPLDRIYVDVIDDRVTKLMSLLKFGEKQLEEYDNEDSVVLESDVHRIAYHYEMEKLALHQKKLDGYIALYDFLRAISLISVGTFWGYLFFLIFNVGFSTETIFFLFFMSFFPYVFFVMFMKFYRRHTLETFMCLIIDKDLC